MKQALFAVGVGFSLTVLPASANPCVLEAQKQEFKPVYYENRLKSIAELEAKTEQLITVSERQLELAEQAYHEAFASKFRLQKNHVSFFSRLVLNKDKLLCSNRAVGYPNNNAYSLNLLTPSAVTAYELNQFLKGTNMAGLGAAFVYAELETGVNAIFLTSLAIHESSWGNSTIARNKSNLFGYGAYDKSPYDSAVHFNSIEEGVVFVANKLKINYLLTSGKYFAGSTLAGVNKRYSSDSKWGVKIATTMNQIDASILANQNTGYEVK
ncbi:glucosaminidase domain-containing protein [Lysinibacillus pakistanensis]|uniref:glucosaminidase domain-containing protein n=1 Tax=Lysinibacillus pakistanensis TaxID=759811 RepID=UPI003D29D9D0